MDPAKTSTDATVIDAAALDRFLHDAAGVYDADTLAEMLADLAAEHAGRITAAPDGGRIVNTMDPARLLDAIRLELQGIKAQVDRDAAAWMQRRPLTARLLWTPAPVIDRLEDAGNLAGKNAYRLALEKPSILAVEARKRAGIGKPLLCINTALKEADLARIFKSLAIAGYIDDSNPAALLDWLNIFNPDADRQGRAVWIKKAKSGSLNKTALLDLLDLLGVNISKWGVGYAATVFGVSISKSTKSKHTRTKSCDREELEMICKP